MAETILKVQMFGKFKISAGNKAISDDDNRSRKIWLLLAYLLYFRKRTVTKNELLNLCWSNEDSSENSSGALKTSMHRVRAALNSLEKNAGHKFIISQSGGYQWNPDEKLSLDIEKFGELCRHAAAAREEVEKIKAYLKAIDIYKGDFLPKLSAQTWVMAVSSYYHGLYCRAVVETAKILGNRGDDEVAAEVCRKAFAIEPYSEEIYEVYLSTLLKMGCYEEVIAAFENLSDMVFSHFGVMPSENLKGLYRKALYAINDKALSMEKIEEQLQEENCQGGAMICSYDFFKMLYQAEARGIERNGRMIHICLLTVVGKDDQPLAKRSLEPVMDNLETLLRRSLRTGDVGAKCSVCQYIIMLPQANYEDSCKVCERLINAYYSDYPHTPAWLKYTIKLLEPVSSKIGRQPQA